MKLNRLSERIWYSDYEDERDRPSLGYIKGERFSLAIDAGHSADHLNEFYEALRENDLPLPELTVVTHWHWDHSFAMHAVNGLTVSNKRTDEYLKEFIVNRSPENDLKFLNLDPCIAREYENGREIIVERADIVFENSMSINAGDLNIDLFQCISAHTDDSTLVYVPEEKVLFLGDALSGAFPTYVPDKTLLREFVKVIEDSEAETFIGGHWPPFTRVSLLERLTGQL